MILGTVHYLSPEQAAGGPIDHRSDQLSLGVVLYELLSGRRPFEGSALSTVLSAILRDAPPPLRSLRSDAPRALERIVHRCLEKNPGDRFASTEALRDALLRVARPSDARRYLDPAVRRAAVITVFVLLVAAGSWLWLRASRIPGVSWYEAAAYAAFAGKSLPTVFHWNQAAFTWSSGEVVRRANFDGKDRRRRAPIGT